MYGLKRICRRPWLSLCSLLLSGVLCFLLSYLSGYVREQRDQLAQVKENFRILCVVTNRSGSRSSALRMTPLEMNAIAGEDGPLASYIEDLRLTKEFQGSGSALNLDKDDILGITNARCHEALNPEAGGEVTLWQEDFWTREDYVCLISQEHLEKLRAIQAEPEAPLASLRVMVEDPYSTSTGMVEFTVAGTYAGAGQTLFLPFPAASALAMELSGRVTCDSAAFVVRDNDTLPELALAAQQDFGAVDPSAGDGGTPRLALTIHDELYRATLANLEQNIRRGELLRPLLLMLCLACGLLTGFLRTRNESRTYALMRTMGVTRGKLTLSMVAEQNLVPMAAVLLVTAGMRMPGQAALCLLFQLLGCVMPIIKLIGTPPTAILKEQE